MMGVGKMGKDNGGPAFPTVYANLEGHYGTTGISMRDYMAIHASESDVERVMLENFDHIIEVYLVTRQQARYMHADFMLAERAK